jgi:hypothetical protein
LTDDHFKFERVSLTYTPNIDNVCLLSSAGFSPLRMRAA